MRTRFYNAEQAAEFLQYPNVQAFEYARKDGRVPAPDTVFQKMPYWSRGTLAENIKQQLNAIANAWGYKMKERQDGKA